MENNKECTLQQPINEFKEIVKKISKFIWNFIIKGIYKIIKYFLEWLWYNKWFFLIVLIIIAITYYLWKATIKSDITGNTEIVALMGVLITFLTVTSYISFEINKKDIESKTKDIAEEFQNFTSAKACFTAAYTLWIYYHCHCEIKKNNNNQNNKFSHEHEILLKNAILEARRSLNFAKKLDSEKQKEFIYRCKNNLAFLLIHLVNPTENDKREAFEHSEYLFQLTNTTGLRNWRYTANKGLTLLRFSNNNEGMKQNGSEITAGVINDFSLLEEYRDEVRKDKEDIIALLK